MSKLPKIERKENCPDKTPDKCDTCSLFVEKDVLYSFYLSFAAMSLGIKPGHAKDLVGRLGSPVKSDLMLGVDALDFELVSKIRENYGFETAERYLLSYTHAYSKKPFALVRKVLEELE